MLVEKRYNTLWPFKSVATATMIDITDFLPRLISMERHILNVSAYGTSSQDSILGGSYQGEKLHISILFSLLDVVGEYITEFSRLGEAPLAALYETNVDVVALDVDHAQELVERACEGISDSVMNVINGTASDLPEGFYSEMCEVLVGIAFILIEQGRNACYYEFVHHDAIADLSFKFELLSPTTIMIGVEFE